jgi:hypothetical protein
MHTGFCYPAFQEAVNSDLLNNPISQTLTPSMLSGSLQACGVPYAGSGQC